MGHPNVPVLECSQKNKSTSFDGRNTEKHLCSFQRGVFVLLTNTANSMQAEIFFY